MSQQVWHDKDPSLLKAVSEQKWWRLSISEIFSSGLLNIRQTNQNPKLIVLPHLFQMKSWKRRFFVLNEYGLFYYVSEEVRCFIIIVDEFLYCIFKQYTIAIYIFCKNNEKSKMFPKLTLCIIMYLKFS